MAVNWEIVSDQQVTALRSALWSGEQDLAVIPKLLKTLLEGDLWKARLVAQTQERVEFKRFIEFVETPAPKGLGTSVETLRKFCQSAGDEEAVDMIDRADQRPAGAPVGNQNARREKTIVDNINNCLRPDGTSAARALRDLRKKRPDLHARVIAKEMSPHAAMIEAGLRKKAHAFPHDPHKAAEAILRHFTALEVHLIIKRLHEGS